MIRWIGLAPWEFEFPSPGSLTSTFLVISPQLAGGAGGGGAKGASGDAPDGPRPSLLFFITLTPRVE